MDWQPIETAPKDGTLAIEAMGADRVACVYDLLNRAHPSDDNALSTRMRMASDLLGMRG